MSTPNLKINRNKDGVSVVPGQVWRDRDYRAKGRHVLVQSVKDGFASTVRCTPAGVPETDRVTVLSVKRMHKHSTGWDLIIDAPPAALAA